ncbi:hypothetical protein [Peribacillus loiseleuriae]
MLNSIILSIMLLFTPKPEQPTYDTETFTITSVTVTSIPDSLQ